MGEPFFRCKSVLTAHQAAVFSSNYALYGDLSARIMELLGDWFSRVEVYSIDEAFLDLSSVGNKNWLELGFWLRKRLWRWTGIPVSIGIAKTKTLAKLANRRAKRESGVYAIESEQQRINELKHAQTTDVWGVGSRYGAMLAKHGVRSAWDLTQQRDGWIQKKMTIQRLRVVHELRGCSCFALEDQPAPRKSMVYSRTFSKPVRELEALRAAVATYTAKLCQKLRAHSQVSRFLQVFLLSQCLENRESRQRWSLATTLSESTAHTPTMLGAAQELLTRLYQPKTSYRKAGVMVTGLESEEASQLSLWHDAEKDNQQKEMMALVDQVQRQHGRKSLFFASEAGPRPWAMKQGHLSPSYTTRGEDLLRISMDLDCSPKRGREPDQPT